jgi:hypothetical protein
VWSNLVKVDQNGERPSAQVEAIISRYALVPREIAIIRPRAVFFLTGYTYDSRLQETFPGCQLEPVAPAIDRVLHSDLPNASFRTYHPNYLRRGRRWDIIDTLIGLIQSKGSP